MTLLGFGLMVSTGCATTQPSLTVTVPESLKDCPASERPASAGLTVGRLAAFSVQQEGDLAKCRAKNAALISIIETVNKASAPKKPWWRF
jgi:hypothetical protein